MFHLTIIAILFFSEFDEVNVYKIAYIHYVYNNVNVV